MTLPWVTNFIHKSLRSQTVASLLSTTENGIDHALLGSALTALRDLKLKSSNLRESREAAPLRVLTTQSSSAGPELLQVSSLEGLPPMVSRSSCTALTPLWIRGVNSP